MEVRETAWRRFERRLGGSSKDGLAEVEKRFGRGRETVWRRVERRFGGGSKDGGGSRDSFFFAEDRTTAFLSAEVRETARRTFGKDNAAENVRGLSSP